MNLITIIGTRPQYIKIKPLYDYFIKNNINNYIVDTNQHYSDNVSKNLIEGLDLKIDRNLDISRNDEILFISEGIINFSKFLCEVKTKIDFIITIGDTNSTLIGAFVSNKMNIKTVHIEAGIRCGDKKRPEEINRILTDHLSDIHFISREKDKANVSNPIYIGDLEYCYLNNIEKEFLDDVLYDNFIIMTIHRQENLNIENLNKIFDLCRRLTNKIIFPIHHRTKKFINDNKIKIPENVDTKEPFNYQKMIEYLRTCRGIISDSGGIIKTSPFFGKKCIIPMEKVEWDDVINEGYGTNKLDKNWFDDYKMSRSKEFYYNKDCCKIILETLLKNVRGIL